MAIELTLLPCPFCGGTNIDPAEWSGNDGVHGPGCGNCGALADSAELWNRRAPSTSTALTDELCAAAEAVVARWDSPKWKDEAPTADYIARLRRAVEFNRAQQGEPEDEDAAFESWWKAHGEFIRAGGGDYEKSFAYGAWKFRASIKAAAPADASIDRQLTRAPSPVKQDMSVRVAPAPAGQHGINLDGTGSLRREMRTTGESGWLLLDLAGKLVRALTHAECELVDRSWQDGWMEGMSEAVKIMSDDPQEIPERYALVPLNYTHEMRAAWENTPFDEDADIEFSNAYRRMIEAAPKPPEGQHVTCGACDGTGYYAPGSTDICEDCNGDGEVESTTKELS